MSDDAKAEQEEEKCVVCDKVVDDPVFSISRKVCESCHKIAHYDCSEHWYQCSVCEVYHCKECGDEFLEDRYRQDCRDCGKESVCSTECMDCGGWYCDKCDTWSCCEEECKCAVNE